MKPAPAPRWLRSLAWLQAAAIVVLAVVLWRTDADAATPQAPASPAAKQRERTDSPHGGGSGATTPVAMPQHPARTVGDAVESPPAAATDVAAAAAAAAPGTVLFGVVADPRGEAVAGAVVFLRRPDARMPLATLGPSAATASYAVAGLEPGTIEFDARAPGCREQHGTIEIPAGVARLRHDFVLQPAWQLRVRVLTPAGTPLAEATRGTRLPLWMSGFTVLATPFEPSGDFPPTDLRAPSYGVGRWRSGGPFGSEKPLPKEFAGVLELDEPQPLWISATMRHCLLATVRVEPSQAEATIVVDPAALAGTTGVVRLRVVDERDAPVVGVRVSCSDTQSGGQPVPTDAEGRAELRDLAAGWLRLSVYGKDGAHVGGRLLLQRGQELELGDVRIAALREIQGRCTGGSGGTADPQQRFVVRAEPLEAPQGPLQVQDWHAEIGAGGAFTLRVPPGRYRVRAAGAGGGLAMLDTATIGDRVLAIALEPEVPIRLAVASRGELFELVIRDAGGRAVFQRWVEDGWKFPILTLPGAYRVEITDRHGGTRVHALQLGADGCDLHVP